MSLIDYAECEPGNLRLYNQAYFEYYGVVGIPQQCIDGVWTTLCDDGTNSLNTPNDLCRAGGAACQYYNVFSLQSYLIYYTYGPAIGSITPFYLIVLMHAFPLFYSRTT